MIATVENMRRCEAAGMTVYAIDQYGDTFSATSGDYFWLGDNEPLTDEDGEPLELAILHPAYYIRVTDDQFSNA